MTTLKTFLSLAYLLPISAFAQGTSFAVSCPLEVPAAALQITPVKPGWVSFMNQPFLLKGAAAAWGPPEEQGLLVGERSEKFKTISTFKFDKIAEGNWIQCFYGEGPEITLSKRLPDDVRECTIENPASRKTEPVKVLITCKN